MPKILHCADLHLDSPFTDALGKGEVRRNKLRTTFTNLIAFCAENEVDLVLMAGDLFDTHYVTPKTLAMLTKEMASLPRTRFLIAPGNHDPYTAHSVWEKAEFPENVTVFSSSEVKRVSLPDLGVDVYGYAFTDSTMERAPIDALRVGDKGRINLLVAHADLLSPLSPYAPTTKEALAATGMDYVALGHVHAASGLQKEGDTYYAYAGCMEGRGFDECGYKGALLLEVEKDGGILHLTASEKRFSLGRYEVETVDLTGATEVEGACRMVREALGQRHLLGMDTSLRLILTGAVHPDMENSEEAIAQMLSPLLYALELRNTTVPIYGAEALERDPGLRGAFYRALKPMMQSEDEETRRRAAKAFALGLRALSGEAPTWNT